MSENTPTARWYVPKDYVFPALEDYPCFVAWDCEDYPAAIRLRPPGSGTFNVSEG